MADRNKSRSDDEMRSVYMGPPMRRNLFGSLKDRLAGNKPKKPYPQSFADDKDPDDEPVLEEVYMGPPMEEEEPKPDEAAPEPAPEAPEPSAEQPAPDLRAMEGVYAGPEMMNRPEMMMVYAGPDYFANRKQQAPMMMAYAGPQFMNMNMADQMKAAQQQAEAAEDKKKEDFCPNCGAMIVAQGRFCSECGAPLPEREMMTCPCCGSLVKKAVFCSECGFLFPKEETESGTQS